MNAAILFRYAVFVDHFLAVLVLLAVGLGGGIGTALSEQDLISGFNATALLLVALLVNLILFAINISIEVQRRRRARAWRH